MTIITAEAARRERVFSWTANVLACLYCAWLGAHLTRGTVVFKKMFEGLGAELPASTRFVVDHRWWLFPTLFGSLVVALLVKEALIRDKRLCTILTFLVTILAQFLGQWLMTLYYLPMFDMMDKLAS